MDTGDDTRHRNRNQNRVMETRVVDTRNGAVLVVVEDIRTVETRVVETRVVDTRNGVVLVVVDIRTVETRVVDTRDGAVLVVDSFS